LTIAFPLPKIKLYLLKEHFMKKAFLGLGIGLLGIASAYAGSSIIYPTMGIIYNTGTAPSMAISFSTMIPPVLETNVNYMVGCNIISIYKTPIYIQYMQSGPHGLIQTCENITMDGNHSDNCTFTITSEAGAASLIVNRVLLKTNQSGQIQSGQLKFTLQIPNTAVQASCMATPTQ
jgi:hypothetical protein